MPRKLIGYFLLSFLSFCFFTVVFNGIAIAQASVLEPSSSLAQPALANPTPTIYETQQEFSQVNQNITLLPTPTIYKQQQTPSTQQPTAQPTQTPVPPTDTPVPTAIPTGTPTPTPTVAPTIATTSDLETLFSKYSAQYGVSEDELKKIANCESGSNPASDTGTYAGMFQFAAGTWTSVRGIMGLDGNPDLRKNAEEAIRTASFMLSKGEQNAWPNCH